MNTNERIRKDRENRAHHKTSSGRNERGEFVVACVCGSSWTGSGKYAKRAYGDHRAAERGRGNP